MERLTVSQSYNDSSMWQAIADPYAFALAQWPAVVGLFLLGDNDWALAVRIALALWLLITFAAAYRRGVGFGNSMTLLAGCVAGAVWSHPSMWMWSWASLIFIGMLAAQRAGLRRLSNVAEPEIKQSLQLNENL